MLIYKNTFDNLMTKGTNFPIEDGFFGSNNDAIVTDGITRDPIGISDFSKCSSKEFLDNYPRPSGGALASKTICSVFPNTSGSLLDRLIKCNESIKELNSKYVPTCDYLENDYYGAVAACISIENDILSYAYICDCGVIIYDKDGNIRFKTDDDKEIYSDPVINHIGIPWNLPEARKIVRSRYRNNPNEKAAYGALTGEETAISFIRCGSIKLISGDIVIVYSDGLTNFLTDKEFIRQILNFNEDSFTKYIETKSNEDYEKYGKEKTLVMYKI